MSTHYCKVGRKKPNLKKLISLKASEEKTVKFIEVVYKKKSTKKFNAAS